MILITGANGNLGSAVVSTLEKLMPKNQFLVSSSSDDGVSNLKSKGFNARKADFSDPSTLENAFLGVTKLLLISTMDPNRLEQHKNVIKAAKKVGVKHLVYTSLAIHDIKSSAVRDLMISHFETEAYLKESGLDYTILRNTMYAEALIQILGQNALHQAIKLPGGTGKVPFVLRREMREATANLLLQSGHEGKTYNITAASSYSFAEVAEVLSELTNSEIKYINEDEDRYMTYLQQLDFPEFLIYLHVGTLKDVAMKQYEIQDDSLELLLGRPSAPLNVILKEIFQI